jgi:hypothetical protein
VNGFGVEDNIVLIVTVVTDIIINYGDGHFGFEENVISGEFFFIRFKECDA